MVPARPLPSAFVTRKPPFLATFRPMPGSSFHFVLSPVLQLRDRAVESARSALGRSVGARAQAEAVLADAEAALAARLADEDGGARTVRQLGGAVAYRTGLARAVDAARRDLDRLRVAEQRAQRDLADAFRQREALATLRAEAADAHRAETLRAQTALLDDLALSARSLRPLTQAA